MATSTRVRGNVNPIFTLKIGSTAVASYADDLKKVALTSDDKDDSDLTFWEAAQGASKDYTLEATAITSFDAGSLWKYLWANAGSEASVVYGPKGNAVPTAIAPHFAFNVSLARPDIELEASLDGTGAEFEVKLKCSTDITMLIAAP
jgi:hypothetical protein